jgi:hypothetical protein
LVHRSTRVAQLLRATTGAAVSRGSTAASRRQSPYTTCFEADGQD